MINFSFNPVGSWYNVIILAFAVTGFTVWGYLPRLRTTTGRWRYFALGFRLAAILLCLFAAARPSVIYQEKKRQPASLVFLLDNSTSMKVADEVGNVSRWSSARSTLRAAKTFCDELGKEFTIKYYRFGKDIEDDTPDGPADEPTGKQTALGDALIEASKRETGQRIASMFVLTDGASNTGRPPQDAAGQLRSRNIPVVTIGYGSRGLGENARDIAVKDLVTPPTVYVKNDMELKGTLIARGFAKKKVVVDLVIDDEPVPVASKTIEVPDGVEQIPIVGLKYRPNTVGEKKVTLRVNPVDGEVVPSNNSISTFVSVTKGGLNVLFIAGPHFSWEYKYFMRSIASSPDIKADPLFLRVPADKNKKRIPDELFTPGRFDVYVLSDLPPNHLTDRQLKLLSTTVENGAGLIMLGGRSSFGMGGWGSTPVAKILPVEMNPADGDLEREQGIRFVPNPSALEGFLLQIGPTLAESRTLWQTLPPMRGINHLGKLKDNANVIGSAPSENNEPIMVATAAGNGRAIAFGGETWIWRRIAEGIPAHKKFWRQVIFWLAHKEDQDEVNVKIALGSRRVSLGDPLDFGVTTVDGKRNPIPGVHYETKIEKKGVSPPSENRSESIELFKQDDQMRGAYPTLQSTAGDYKITVVATKDGREIGRDSARFLIYQDDLELDNPSADRSLLRQISETTGGSSIPSEQLPEYLRSIREKLYTETLREIEKRLWDNWPFLLLFVTFLTMEWWIRKYHGWV